MTNSPICRQKGFGNDLDSIRSGISSLFDSFFEESRNWDSSSFWKPALDISENKKEIILKADIPGVTEKDIDVSVENGYLTISGTRQESKKEKNEERVITERFYGSFKRIVKLPQGIKPDSIKADFSNGVLTITAPRGEKPAEKKIEINIQ